MDVDADVLVMDITARIHRGAIERRKGSPLRSSPPPAPVSCTREWRQ